MRPLNDRKVENWLRGGPSCLHKELSGRGDDGSEGWEERRVHAKEDGGGFGVAPVKRTESVNAVYRMLRIACSSSHAFRSRRRETVVEVLALLRARTIEKVARLYYEVRSTLLRRHCIQMVDTRYLVKLLLQALSEHVGAGCSLTIDQGPGSCQHFVPARRDRKGNA